MDVPTECPVCGAYSLTHNQSSSALLAVTDVLVFKALETIGKRIVRAERSRFQALRPRPFHEAHTLWRISEPEVGKALRGAWDVVPPLLTEHGCCDVTVGGVERMLDSYVHDLVVAQATHSTPGLAYRFTSRLGLPVYLRERERV